MRHGCASGDRLDGAETEEKMAPGSRSTPTVDGDRVYVQSGLGAVTCLAAADGTIKAFGKAPSLARPAARRSRLVDLVPSATGRGYLCCWSDGEVSAHGHLVLRRRGA